MSLLESRAGLALSATDGAGSRGRGLDRPGGWPDCVRVSRPAGGFHPQAGAQRSDPPRAGAIVIIDVAQDFGAAGEDGLRLLASVRATHLQPDVIMVSFSKTFAANGGFVAASAEAVQYLQYYAAPVLFSNAMFPMQAAVSAQYLDIVFSGEGVRLRQALDARIALARDYFQGEGCAVAGQPSPIVPVFVGQEASARLTARYLLESRLLANLVEFPAVPRGKARFRFQIMANHRTSDIAEAARTFGECTRRAAAALAAGCGRCAGLDVEAGMAVTART